MTKRLLLDIDWTDDCQGKRDYDGAIVSISSRYWPRGGGFTAICTRPGHAPVFEGNETRPYIPPSARSSLIVRYRDGDEHDSIELASQDFEADTPEGVREQVEFWAQLQMDRVVSILREHFDVLSARSDTATDTATAGAASDDAAGSGQENTAP